MRFVVGIFGVGSLTFALAQTVPQKPTISFRKDVQPVIKSTCVGCHGKNGAAGLDLSTDAAILKTKTILKGNAEKSVFLRRIKGLDGKPQMPMGFKPLTAEQVKTIETWINEGANIDKAKAVHWAYVAPKKPAIPTQKAKWSSHPIDAFTLEKMTQQGYKPSPRASKETLARRASLDLIGLPPTVQELDQFLQDKSPKAYENYVDRLLASPHYGERQARIWLDLARYADSNGYEKDQNRVMWPYRDWVIQAFNRNLPFDQFTVQQLAGDMLPSPTEDQLIATGFHRNTMFNEEGGNDPAESFYKTIIDRVATTSTVWLGSTIQCAQCHDHKYDPFSQKDFFRMYGVFANVDYYVYGDYTKSDVERWIEPAINVQTAKDRRESQVLETNLARLIDKRQRMGIGQSPRFQRWLSAKDQKLNWKALKLTSSKIASGSTISEDSNGVLNVSGPKGKIDTYELTFTAPNTSVSGLKIEVVPVDGAVGRSNSANFVLTGLKVKSDSYDQTIKLADASFIQEGYSLENLSNNDVEKGWAVYPRGNIGHQLILDFGTKLTGKTISLEMKFDSKWEQHTIKSFRISSTDGEFPLLDLPKKQSIKDEDRWLETDAFFADINRQIADVERQLKAKKTSGVQALILREKPTKGPILTTLYRRGEFSMPGEKVEAGVPSVLPKLATQANRLSVAQWLVDPKNPLTARVQVNRIWEQYFGQGIVKTVEDFGTQSSPPSHQKLLDWLAVTFIESGWDMKKLHKLIVTSETYKQSSKATKNLLERDPANVYLARGPRFRMEAEMIRDTALQISGLLNPEIGGPSVMPYQPAGVWDTPYNGQQWMEAQDKDRHRRGLYVFAKRTAMYPSFMAFDATSREACTVKRSRTNTPLQALTLLNDQVYLEAAKALGERMERESITNVFVAATSRKPSTKESELLKKTYQRFLSRYQSMLEDAKKLGGTPESAARTMLANVILNLDEVITKG